MTARMDNLKAVIDGHALGLPTMAIDEQARRAHGYLRVAVHHADFAHALIRDGSASVADETALPIEDVVKTREALDAVRLRPMAGPPTSTGSRASSVC